MQKVLRRDNYPRLFFFVKSDQILQRDPFSKMDDKQCLGGGAGIYHRGQYLSKDPVDEKDAGNS